MHDQQQQNCFVQEIAQKYPNRMRMMEIYDDTMEALLHLDTGVQHKVVFVRVEDALEHVIAVLPEHHYFVMWLLSCIDPHYLLPRSCHRTSTFLNSIRTYSSGHLTFSIQSHKLK